MSVLKVVATIEMPTSHHGAARPEVKNSPVLELARRQKNSAGRKEMRMDAATIAQSSVVSCMQMAPWKAGRTLEGDGRKEKGDRRKKREGKGEGLRCCHSERQRGIPTPID